MNEIDVLVSAIESLKPSVNNFKDYIYPVIAPFFATLLGAWAGYAAAVKKQSRDNDVRKLQSLNRLLLQAENCFRNLEAIKDNYAGSIDGNPLRALSFGPLVLDHEKANTDLSDLVFLTKSLNVDLKNIETGRLAFNNLTRIRQIFHNHNQVLAIFEQRNIDIKPIFKKLRTGKTSGVVEGDAADLFKKVGREEVAIVCHLTEMAFKLTDAGLKELLGLMQELPELSKVCFDKKFLKEEGGIVMYLNDPNVTGKILKRVPTIDKKTSINIFGDDISL